MRKFIALIASFLLPIAAFAQSYPTRDIWDLLFRGQSIMALLIRVLMGFAVLVVVWGVIKFIIAGSSGSEEASKQAKSTILYGILGLFVITSIWALVAIFSRTTGIPSGTTPPPPPALPF